jgi:hypothetical protein
MNSLPMLLWSLLILFCGAALPKFDSGHGIRNRIMVKCS